MKIGDYVRTKYGIAKCIKATPIRENSFLYEFDREVYEDVFHLTVSELEKYKSSPNIIDLIEVGDYVNGYPVKDIYIPPNEKVGKIIRFDAENVFGWDCEPEEVYAKDIKSILTKEQFESMEYKVGE